MYEYSVRIDWGDGQKSGGTLKANAQNTFDIAGTHTYGTTGFYTLTVTITEVGGQSVTVTHSSPWTPERWPHQRTPAGSASEEGFSLVLPSGMWALSCRNPGGPPQGSTIGSALTSGNCF